MGDSLARGVGHKLAGQCGRIVDVDARGGAKIEEVASVVKKLDDTERNVVLIAGANNLEGDSSEDILKQYEQLLDSAKKPSIKKVVVVGLTKRYDLGQSYERKRILINMRLRNTCKSRNVEYIEYEPERSRVHTDGLHLNHRGQFELGQQIFKRCIDFLV